MNRVQKDGNGCWHFRADLNSKGYGRLYRDGKRAFAHRVSYELHVGPIAQGLLVLHRCDVTTCVNPDHLFLGTFKDNYDDMVSKGRSKLLKGEEKKGSKLTDERVRFIRSSSKRVDQLAAMFGVSREAIYDVKSRKTWRHVA